MIIEVKQADIFNATESILIQQCNCYTVKAHALSATITQHYPWANVYGRRIPIRAGRNCALNPASPGTICIDSNGAGNKHVVHLFAQVLPGLAGQYSRAYPQSCDGDTASDRVEYFRRCIAHLESEILDDQRVAVPDRIGCGHAGGDWRVYRAILEASSIQFVIYHHIVSN